MAVLLGAMLVCAPGAVAAGVSWSAPVQLLGQAPFADPGESGGVACPSRNLCVAVDNYGNVLSSRAPTTAQWTSTNLVAAGVLAKATQFGQDNLFGVACPSTHLCVTLDGRGDILTATDPTGGARAWRVIRVPRLGASQGGQISCPSARLCVAAANDGRIAVSTHPGRGSAGWKVTTLDSTTGSLWASCASRRLCVVASDTGRIFVSTRPANGRRAWRRRTLERPFGAIGGIDQVACPSAHLCVAIDGTGRVLHTTKPLGGPRTWKRTSAMGSVTSLTCPSTRLCIAGDSGGVDVTTRPRGGARAWRLVRYPSALEIFDAGFPRVACAGTRLCLYADWHGIFRSSTRPSSPHTHWSLEGVDADNPLTALACPGSLCVATADDVSPDSNNPGVSALAASGAPGAGVAAWNVSRSLGTTSLACPSSTLCIGGDGAGNILASTTPANPASGWTTADVVPTQQVCDTHCQTGTGAITALSCASATLCAGFANDELAGVNYYLSSSAPAGGASAWSVSSTPSFFGTAISCPADNLCVAVQGSKLATTSTPTSAGSWSAAPVDPGNQLLGVSCSAPAQCVAVDNRGQVLTSGTPAVPSSWTAASIDPGHPLLGVSCLADGQCIAFDDRGEAATAVDFTSVLSWTMSQVEAGVDVRGDPLHVTAASCPTPASCVAVDNAGNVITGSG